MTDLPQGWVKTTLGELGKWSSGGTPSRKNPAFYGGEIQWVKTGDLNDSYLDCAEETITEDGLKKSSAKVFPAGTLLIAMYGATIGRTAVLRTEAATNQACAAFLPNGLTSQIIPFVWWYVRANIEEFRSLGQGGAQPNISQTLIKSFPIYLPPIAEQRRIVAKLDSLFDRTRRAREELAHVPTLIEHYKQAILAAAYDLAADSDSSFVTLGDLAVEVRNGLAKRPENHPPGIPILKISALRPMMVRMEERRYYVLSKDEDISRYALEPGDLLFTRYNGNPDLVASCGMIREKEDLLVYPDKLIRVRLDQRRINPQFLEAMASSKQARESLAPHIKSAAGQHGISGGDLKRLPLPVPCLQIQQEIVEFVDSAFARINHLGDETSAAIQLLDHLDQATLAKAFQGELVPQDPDDEPASALLERIRAAQVDSPNPKSRGRKPRKNAVKNNSEVEA